MPAVITVDDYLDPDVAYLLGLIAARGQLYVEGDIRRLIIDFPFRLFEARPPRGSKLKFNIPQEVRLCLDDVRNRINELLEVNVQINRGQHNNQLLAVFTKNTMSWRNLTTLFASKSSYQEFAIPPIMFEVPRDIQLEFVRGFADASATPTQADHAQFGADSPKLHRIVLQVQHENWTLPTQLCRLLQVKLGVPVQHILWGHPNIRNPKGGGSQWAKEHRIRIYADNFMPVGFHFGFKQRILEEMAKHNQKFKSQVKHTPCNPLGRHKVKHKEHHKDERSKKLPSALRGHHFDAYFEICQKLGCTQGSSSKLVQISDV